MALDTLWAAVWTPSDVPLDRAGRRLPGWRDRPVCIELHYRRRNRWFRSGVAADCGGVVCATDGVPADRWMIFLRHGNMENCRSCRWKNHSQPDGKRHAFSHRPANSFPTASQFWQFYAHSHNAYYGEICFFYRNRTPFMLKLKYIL